MSIYDEIRPPAAEKLGIPLNEIWISEKWKKYERYILYHELQEIKYRAMGYGKEEAHVSRNSGQSARIIKNRL